MTMKTLIVCASVHHHNTAKIAEAIGEMLSADIRTPESASASRLDDYDLIGFGSGIYFGGFHRSLRSWVHQLPDDQRNLQPAFVFTTSGLPRLWKFWHRPFVNLLSRKGFCVEEQFHCGGFDTFGPLWLWGGINRNHPNEQDFELARSFARKLLGIYGHREANIVA